ncbi:MAG: glycosyltransferase, partial [Opitutus sp.]
MYNLRRRLYYTLKPFLPWRLRMALRRYAASRILRRHASVWPINPEAAKAPDFWPGWPGGKQFTVVLTHDVEGYAGLAKVRALAQIEMDLGFRSSFNFIPEGPYRVPAELRDWLTSNGFEVGVHDLNHDGKLYHSHAGFRKKAERINHHLRDWGATGFRSGFMLRNLDWIHRLDIQYDSSTFDTDPFEPQSTGANTIFPYWIRHRSTNGLEPPGFRSASAGYVELPYTLPQDSTLFLLLQEAGPEVWLRKLDWVAEHGGMALLNVHPDYIQLDGDQPSSSTYPIAHYRHFLQHLLSRHSNSYWPALPREVAAMTAQLVHPPELHRPKRVGMITHSFYESDNRVTRYAEALRDRGDHVEVIALRRSAKYPAEESLRGVDVSRIQFRIKKSEQTKLAYFWPMLRFLLLSSWIITRRHAKRPYDILHVHNMPDFLVFSAWYPKLTGVKLILDIHDIVPELYASKFGDGKQPALMPLLKAMERLSASFANHVIV